MVEHSLDRISETQNPPTFDSVWQEVARENSGFGKGLQAEAKLIRGAVSNLVPGIKEAAQHAIENPLSTGAKLAGMVALGYGLGMVSRTSVLHTAVRGAFAYALLADGVRPIVRSTNFVWDHRDEMAIQYQQKQLGRGLGHFAFDLGLTLPAIGLGVKLARTPKLGAMPSGEIGSGFPRSPSDAGAGGRGTGTRTDIAAPAADTTAPPLEVRAPEVLVPEAGRGSVTDTSAGDASTSGMSSPRPLHEALAELARLARRPGTGAGEVRPPEVVRPAEAEVRPPEVVTPAEGEVRAPEVVTPAEAEVRAPEVVTPAEAEVRAPEVVTPAEGQVRAPEVVRPAEAEVRAPEVVTPAEGQARAPEVVTPAEGEVRPPEVVTPAEAEVRAPEVVRPADEAVTPLQAETPGPVEGSGRTDVAASPAPQEVDIVIRPPAQPVEPVKLPEPAVEPAPELPGNGAALRADTGGNAYEAVAPQAPPTVEPVPGADVKGPGAKPVPEQRGGGKGRKKAKPVRPAPEVLPEDDPYAGLDARTRRIMEEDGMDFGQNRGRKQRRDRGGRNRGGNGGRDEY